MKVDIDEGYLDKIMPRIKLDELNELKEYKRSFHSIYKALLEFKQRTNDSLSGKKGLLVDNRSEEQKKLANKRHEFTLLCIQLLNSDAEATSNILRLIEDGHKTEYSFELLFEKSKSHFDILEEKIMKNARIILELQRK